MKHISHPDWQKVINVILEKASSENRAELYEYEVYRILEILEIRTPKHTLITEESQIDRELLSRFGSSRVVLKIVSPEVAHKEKLGGVKVLHKDLDFIRYSYLAMMERFGTAGYKTEGALLTEFIDYSPELGNEVMIGFRESETFGPVISFSKGGSDAEHFAKHFSPPNLVLPPINADWARALLSSTEIHKKYEQEGKGDFMEQILNVKLKFSELSTAFSNFFPSDSSYTLKEFEINPFVFDKDHRMIALDGYAVFAKDEAPLSRPEVPKDSRQFTNIDAFFRPKGIAVVGVSSSDSLRPGNIIVSNLLRLKRQDVYCVNPKGGSAEIEKQDVPLYQSLQNLPAPVELVVVTVPAGAARAVVEEAVSISCKAILLIPGGFSETSHDKGPEEEILRLCREKDIRIMGPNCLGRRLCR